MVCMCVWFICIMAVVAGIVVVVVYWYMVSSVSVVWLGMN